MFSSGSGWSSDGPPVQTPLRWPTGWRVIVHIEPRPWNLHRRRQQVEDRLWEPVSSCPGVGGRRPTQAGPPAVSERGCRRDQGLGSGPRLQKVLRLVPLGPESQRKVRRRGETGRRVLGRRSLFETEGTWGSLVTFPPGSFPTQTSVAVQGGDPTRTSFPYLGVFSVGLRRYPVLPHFGTWDP